MKLNDDIKYKISKKINDEKSRHGSFNRLARSCNVSNGTISNMLRGKWDLIKDDKWFQVASSLGFSIESDWQIAETFNIKQMTRVIETARSTRSFWAVSHKAGSGKTASLKLYANLNVKGVYLIQASEWTQRQFLHTLISKLGIELKPGYNTVNSMLDQVVSFFNSRINENPILIIDEADKLKDAAKRLLIPIFNRLEDKQACLIAGTENLEQEIKRGVKRAKKGFDELDSRFGRNYIHLVGATYKDVAAICNTNGVTDQEAIKKIFKKAQPINVAFSGTSAHVVEDLRRVKRLVIAERAFNVKPEPVNYVDK